MPNTNTNLNLPSTISNEQNQPKPIDPDDDRWLPLLQDLQGNILKAHGREYATHIFLHFNTDLKDLAENDIRQQIRSRIAKWAPSITSAWQDLQESELCTEFDMLSPFVSFFLTMKGYEALGESDSAPDDEAFRNGMRRRKSINDSDPITWDQPYGNQDIHAMIMLADDNQEILKSRETRVLTEIIRGEVREGKYRGLKCNLARVLQVERGAVIRNHAGEPIEHFGYVDGLSNPLFLTTDLQDNTEDHWKPWAPLDLVLVRDKGANHELSKGSYLVFRKLEQNVKRFMTQRRQLAQSLDPNAWEQRQPDLTDAQRKSIQLAGAHMIGRYEDGTALMIDTKGPKGDRSYPNSSNDFSYEQDPKGATCPFHAHIRSVNPRTEEDKRHRIVRRGIPYGLRSPQADNSIDALPSGGVGLLFMCYQSSIENQFEYLQALANGSDTENLKGTNVVDAIIGQPLDGKRPPSGHKHFSFLDVVTLKGGEYFFAPSISYLAGLGEPK